MARRIFIVDDHPIVRRGLQQLIDEEPDLVASGQAEGTRDALAAIEEDQPDLVLVDVSLEGPSGMELTRELQARWPDLPVLVLSLHDERLYAQRALQAGARGYVMKRASDDEVVCAIRQALRGETVVSEDIRTYMDADAGVELPGAAQATLDQLSDREFEVFQLLGRGFAPRHIAEQLSVSVKTVEVYRQRLKDKLGVDSAAMLTRYAVAWQKEQS